MLNLYFLWIQLLVPHVIPLYHNIKHKSVHLCTTFTLQYLSVSLVFIWLLEFTLTTHWKLINFGKPPVNFQQNYIFSPQVDVMWSLFLIMTSCPYMMNWWRVLGPLCTYNSCKIETSSMCFLHAISSSIITCQISKIFIELRVE